MKQDKKREQTRRKLIEATRNLLQKNSENNFEASLESLTVQAITQEAGVSRNTLYRYFGGDNKNAKDHLIAATSAEEFRELTIELQSVRANRLKSPLARFKDSGLRYGSFGLDPEKRYRFSLMFGSTFNKLDEYDELKESVEGAFQELVGFVKDCQEAGLIGTEPRAEAVAFGAWGSIHGLVILYLSGVFGIIAKQVQVKEGVEIGAIANFVADALLEGLRVLHQKSLES